MGFPWLLQFPPIDHKQVYGSFPVTAGMDTSTPVNLVKNKQHQSNCNSKKKLLNRSGLDVHQPCQVKFINLTGSSLNAPNSANKGNI